jgi:hypothetical protein
MSGMRMNAMTRPCLDELIMAARHCVLAFGLVLTGSASGHAHDSHARSTALVDVDDIPLATPALKLVYSRQYQTLIVDTGNQVLNIDLSTHASAAIAPLGTFTDIAISPSGRYVFATDWLSDNLSLDESHTLNYVHRFDLGTMLWDPPETVWEAGSVQAVADDQVIVKSRHAFQLLVNARFTGGTATTPINTPTTFYEPAFYSSVYGDSSLLYDSRSGRLLIAESGSSRAIFSERLTGNDFVLQEDTINDGGSVSKYGGTAVLATDMSGFYYGALEVDPLDVTHQLRIFPEAIYAATGDIAFGAGNYYDARTGEFAGNLGRTAHVYGLDVCDTDFWIYDDTDGVLRHFVVDAIFSDGFDS